ncbi:MAG TPA: LacI family DNA-binding transcriptional regulator [Capsulimonadaceae bacterium]|jgi:LacI family transcriptional regulator
MATQQEIADRLKISRSLVAQALSGTPGARVSASTRDRILKVADELGYRPNNAARALRTGKTHTVTFFQSTSPDSQNPTYYTTAVDGCSKGLGILGYELKVSLAAMMSDPLQVLSDIGASRSSDLVILWGAEEDVERHGELLQQIGVPFVVKGRHEVRHPDWLQIDFDHEGMTRDALSHLAALGHTRIAYIGYDTDAAFARLLLDGYRSSHVELLGKEPDPRLIARVDASRAASEAVTDSWFRLPTDEQPTAIVIGSSSNSWTGTEVALHKHGLTIGDTPGHIAIAGLASRGYFTLFGSGRFFPANDLTKLGEEMIDRLAAPAMRGETPPSNIIRLVPDFMASECLNLPNRAAS